MASSEQVTVEQASPQDVSETTPLVKRKKSTKGDSLLIKSKAVALILFWTALMSFVYGALLNPEVYFVLLNLFNRLTFYFFSVTTVINVTITSGIYAVFAFWLLFYPLAGYLADVRYGRYKVVRCSVLTVWCGLLALLIIGGVVSSILVPIITLGPEWKSGGPIYTNLWIFFAVVMGILGFCVAISWFVAFAGFLANVIQFGVDQLVYLPARDSFLFIHWFFFTLYIGISFGKLVWSVGPITGFLDLPVFGLVLLVNLICVLISLCVAKRRWFIVDTGTVNPYKDVARVIGFARRNKIPIQRSAFTFWEDDIPTGLDLGKEKYGGPFTTEQVENVKSFFGIVLILLSLGPFFAADIAAAPFLSVLGGHMEVIYVDLFQSPIVNSIFYSMFLTGGALYPLFLVIFVPIFLKFIHPLFQKYFPGTLRRTGVGLCLITLTLFCSMSMDTIGHILPNGHNATSIFASTYFIAIDKSLRMSSSFLIIQQVLIAIAYVFIYGGVFEFICAQSPHSMKGFLIGILFAIKGLFQLISVLGILLPFSFWQSSPRAGLVYFLVNIVISVVGVVVFTVAAKRYQYRQRDELCNERKYIEEVFAKDVSHNQDFDDLDVPHFDSDSL